MWTLIEHVGSQPPTMNSRSNHTPEAFEPLTKGSRNNPPTNCTRAHRLAVPVWRRIRERNMKNLAIWSKTVVEDTTMMASTEPNFTRPLFRCNEGAFQFGSVMTKYPMCDNDRPTVVLIL
jgi:hypothetical protein